MSLMFDSLGNKIGAGLLATVVLIGGLFLVWKMTSTPAVPKQVTITIDPIDHQIGTDSAKVTLVEYSDLQCPACRAYHGIVKQVIAEYKDKIRFVYRHFPLTQIHQNALAASYAAEAAAQQDKFFEFHDLLFENQSDWAEEKDPGSKFEEYAKELELDIKKFTADKESSETKARVQRDIDSGNKLPVQATPTFIVNDLLLENVNGYEDITKALDAILEAK